MYEENKVTVYSRPPFAPHLDLISSPLYTKLTTVDFSLSSLSSIRIIFSFRVSVYTKPIIYSVDI